ncbi:MAG: hypothetical protein Tsb009_34690 [Planctomycetaceae bacterium]
MMLDLSENAKELVNKELETGAYSSASEVVEVALRNLAAKRKQEETIQAIREGVADAEAGRVHSVEEAFHQIEESNPYLRES